MTRAAIVAACLAAVVVPPGAAAKQRLTCSSGITTVLDGRLRIFGVPFHDRYGTVGADEYACMGRSGRPMGIGFASESQGTASSDTPIVTFDGKRYIAVLATEDGEGGPDADYEVFDLRTGRRVTFAAALAGEEPEPFRITAAGGLVSDDYGIQLVPRGHRGDSRFIKPLGAGGEIAYTGNTIYWTEKGIPHSAPAKAPATAPENRVYDLRSRNAFRVTRGHGRCESRRGTTIAASPHIRVLARNGRRLACRRASAKVHALGPRTGAAGELRIVRDRWLLSRTANGATVLDMRGDGTVVTAVDGAATSSTLTTDGTLAWIDADGRLLAQRPRDDTPAVLAEAAAVPTTLASSDTTIYWTAGGLPQRWPSAERAAQ
jgi:hypothetical protein